MATPLLIVLSMGCPGFGDGVPSVAGTPDLPTWDDDVEAILAANCVSCHGESPNYSGQTDFRLDWYAGEEGVLGASEKQDRIQARAIEGEFGFMPYQSVSGMGEVEKATVAKWIELGGPETADDVTP